MANTRRNATKSIKIETTANKSEETEALSAIPTEKTYTESELKNIVNAAVASALDEYKKNNAETPKMIQVAKEETITLMYAAPMAKGCTDDLGALGQINRPFGTIEVPKKMFVQYRDYKVDKQLEQRRLIVLDGLTEEEKERYGLEYKDGELLTQTVYYKLLDFDAAKMCEIFRNLCESHMRTVATTFFTAYIAGDKRVTADKVKPLNDISKAVDKDGLFEPIITDMAKRFAENDI